MTFLALAVQTGIELPKVGKRDDRAPVDKKVGRKFSPREKYLFRLCGPAVILPRFRPHFEKTLHAGKKTSNFSINFM
jgi:hypothetical protein